MKLAFAVAVCALVALLGGLNAIAAFLVLIAIYFASLKE